MAPEALPSIPASARTRILVRLPNPLGDAVMATPALRALRQGLPDAEIFVQGLPHHEGLLRDLESVDHFLPVRGRGLRALRGRAAALRELGFDAALILPDSHRAALDAWLARIPRRVGYARDFLRRVLLSEAVALPLEDGRRVPISMVERYLRLVRELGLRDAGHALDLATRESARERAAAILAEGGIGADEAVLLVTPGAGFGPSKLWPPRHFGSACDQIRERYGLVPVIAPAPSEEEVAIARQVSECIRGRHLALLDPDPSLEVFKALVERAALVISNDTGPRHVAVALERPVVTLIGPNDPRHTAHLLERQRVLYEDVACRPCNRKQCTVAGHPCLEGLAPERAVAAAAELLGAS